MKTERPDINPSGPEGRGTGLTRRDRRTSEMEKTFEALLAGLPELDLRQLQALAAEARAYPANSYPRFLEKLQADDPAECALAFLLLRECGDAELKDTLNATVFDISQDDLAKVRANELLTELGSPIDPDVLEMTVPEAAQLAAGSPWSLLRTLDAGQTEAAAEVFCKLDARTRAVLIHHIARKDLTRALSFFQTILGEDEANARAVASALGQSGAAAAVPLLLQLVAHPAKEVQKTVKRMLFLLRAAGVAVPEAEPAREDESLRESPAATAVAEAGLPVHKALVGQTPSGLVAVVAVAREYPNGRLNTLIIIVDFWRRGIVDARHWISMSRSEFRRYIQERFGTQVKFREASLEECRRLAARGLRVAQELGTPIPFDFQTGKGVLGELAADVAALSNPFICSQCQGELDDESIARLRATAGYDMPAETRCARCRRAASAAAQPPAGSQVQQPPAPEEKSSRGAAPA